MSKIPTIKEFLKGRQWKDGMNLQERIHESMIEFAKLHVEAALESRDRLYETYYVEEIKFTESNKEFIKKSYPLENIK